MQVSPNQMDQLPKLQIDMKLPITPTEESSRKRKLSFSPKFALSSSSTDSVPAVKELDLLNEHLCEEKKYKSVSFDPTVHVVLIPRKEEYYEAKIAHRVWYTPKELARMEKEAIVSVSLGHFYDYTKDEIEDEEYGDCSQIYSFLV